MRRTLPLVLLFSLGTVEASARPGNLERFPIGADRAGLGGAGVASPGSAWFNPAGLARATEHGISASLSAYGYTVEKSTDFVFWDLGDGTSIAGDLETAAVDLFPATLEYVKPLGQLGPLQHAAGVSIIVPDFDQFDGRLNVPATDLLVELRARRISESQTFWILPAWSACAGKLCFGLGPALAVRQESDVAITTFFLEADNGAVADATSSSQYELLTASLGGSAGLQYEVSENFWIGATVRTPVFKVWGQGSQLEVLTLVDEINGLAYVDRVEVAEPQTDFKTPWRFALGASYAVPGSFEVAADVRFMTGQSPVSLVAGPNGETTLPPTFPGGQIDDPARALDVERAFSLSPTINANLGGRVYFSERIAGQMGLFTDLSATSDDEVLLNGDEQLSRIGVTLGGGYLTAETQTWATVIYAYGFGNLLGLGTNFDPQLAALTSHSILLMLGSSADF